MSWWTVLDGDGLVVAANVESAIAPEAADYEGGVTVEENAGPIDMLITKREGGAWVPDLDVIRQRKWDQVKAERMRRQYLTFTLAPGIVLDCHEQARTFVQSRVRQAMARPGSFPIQFTLADNSQVWITAEQMLIADLVLADFDAAIWEHGEQLRLQIYEPAETDPATINAIDHLTGWPE